MQITWDTGLIILSVLVATFGSFTALSHAQRMRESASGSGYWLWAGGITLGIAIWSMHFIGMLAMQLPIQPAYDLSLTLISVLPAIVAAVIGFYLIRSGAIHLKGIVLGGVAMGAGIVAMHYSGMLALRIAPSMRFDFHSIVLSVVVAITVSVAALLILQQSQSEKALSSSVPYQSLAALVMGCAISGMHYSSMIGLHIAEHSQALDEGSQIPLSVLALIVTVGVIFLSSGGLAAGFFDRRMVAQSIAAEKAVRLLNENLAYLVDERTKELRLSEMRFRDFIATVPGAVYEFVVDASGKRSIPFISEGIVDLVGLSASECMSNYEVLFCQIDSAAVSVFEASLQASLENLVPWSHEFPCYTVKNERRWLRGQAIPKREKNGSAHWSGVLIDITAQKQNELRVIEMATRDVLTGLPNRYLLRDRITRVLATNSRMKRQAAVLFIDLDHFKIINDSLGHDVGDMLLKEVAKRLTTIMRDEDTIARQGGDEFIVLLPNVAVVQDAEVVAQKILTALIRPFHIHQNEMHIGGSIGVALYPVDGVDVDALLKNSDIAMYHAKGNGGNNYRFFNAEMDQLATERHVLSVDLHHAVERNELLLHFQPVISAANRRIVAFEVLLRWQHAQHGMISPLKFIPIAEETGLIVSIGEWVLRESCLQIKSWQDQGYEVPMLAINVSARQFRKKTLAVDFARILQETNVAANRLILEITESMLIDNIEETNETLQHLSDLGMGVSVDDFGIGYSSLTYLKRYPIDVLKIDRSFVRDIATDSDDAAICGAIIALAHSLEKRVVAEGIETKQQLDFLQQQGCDSFQGYYFSRPLPAEEAERMLGQADVGASLS